MWSCKIKRPKGRVGPLYENAVMTLHVFKLFIYKERNFSGRKTDAKTTRQRVWGWHQKWSGAPLPSGSWWRRFSVKPPILPVSRTVLCKTNRTSPYLLPPARPFFPSFFRKRVRWTHFSGSRLVIINNNDGLDLRSAFQHSECFTLEPLFISHSAHTVVVVVSYTCSHSCPGCDQIAAPDAAIYTRCPPPRLQPHIHSHS